MLSMLRIAATSYGLSKFKHRMQQSVSYAMTIALGSVIAFVGVIFLLNALWTQLAYVHGPVIAGSIVGGGLIVFAIILTSVMFLVQKKQASNTALNLQDAVARLGDRIPSKMASDQGLKTLAVLVGLGYLIGKNVLRK